MGDLVPIRPDAVLPPEVLGGGQVDWAALDPDADDDWEWDHRGPLRELVDSLLADMRDASTQLDGLGPEAREVGRWLHGRVAHAVVATRHLS